MNIKETHWPSFFEIVEYLHTGLTKGEASFYQFKTGRNVTGKITKTGHIINDITIYKDQIYFTLEIPADLAFFELYKLIIIHEKTKETKTVTIETTKIFSEIKRICRSIMELAGLNNVTNTRTPENSLLFKELIKGMKK